MIVVFLLKSNDSLTMGTNDLHYITPPRDVQVDVSNYVDLLEPVQLSDVAIFLHLLWDHWVVYADFHQEYQSQYN
jgi:hypothetical protein